MKTLLHLYEKTRFAELSEAGMGGRVYAKMNGIHLRVIIAHRKEGL